MHAQEIVRRLAKLQRERQVVKESSISPQAKQRLLLELDRVQAELEKELQAPEHQAGPGA